MKYKMYMKTHLGHPQRQLSPPGDTPDVSLGSSASLHVVSWCQWGCRLPGNQVPGTEAGTGERDGRIDKGVPEMELGFWEQELQGDHLDGLVQERRNSIAYCVSNGVTSFLH